MNQIMKLVAALKKQLPKADLELIRPRDPKGRWTLEVEHAGWLGVVVWLPSRGFGLRVGPLDEEAAYGENLDEVYPGEADDLAEHVVRLLTTKKRTSPPRSVALKEIRARCGLTQADVARRLSMRQGTVSKLERSTRLDVDKLSELVQAMGGELELWVRFPDDAPVKLMAPSTQRRPRSRRKRR